MSIWYAIPSCRPLDEANHVLAEWKVRGYKLAILRQAFDPGALPSPHSTLGDDILGDVVIRTTDYLGWAYSVNLLAKHILAIDPLAEWIVTGGDDYYPVMDRNAESIARECWQHFMSSYIDRLFPEMKGRPVDIILPPYAATYGVMQPTGDRYGDGYIDTSAASPWMGRTWCERAYGGRGPMNTAYHHYFADTELQAVAIKQHVFWQRPDLRQEHRHWTREAEPKMPAFLANPMSMYGEAMTLFNERNHLGFPGSAPL